MPKNSKKRRVVPKRKAATRKTAKRATTKPSTITVEQPTSADSAAYIEALIATGEAAPLDKEGKLPPGATHKLDRDADGNVRVTRRRFSIA